MASRQDPRVREDVRGKEVRAEEAARAAADELHDVNKQRGEVVVEHNENRPGIIGSVFQTITGTLGGAKDAVIGKSTHEAHDKASQASEYEARKARDATMSKASEAKEATKENMGYAAEKTKETADATAQKAKEAKDYTADKAKEAKDATMGKMGEYKDYAAQKAYETKDYTAEKAKEGKDTTLSGLKDFFTGGKKDDFRKGTLDEAEDDARRKMETMHLKDQGYEARGTGLDTTSSGRGDEVVMKRTTATVVDPMDKTAEALRKADQMTGQAFNDVGPMDR